MSFNMTKAVSLIAIPIGFVSLSSLFFSSSSLSCSSLNSSSSKMTSKEIILQNYLEFEKNLNFSHIYGVTNMFKSFESCIIILKTSKNLFNYYLSKDILTLFYNDLNLLQQNIIELNKQVKDSKVIVVEGLPKNGITTLIQNFISSSIIFQCPQLPQSFQEIYKILTLLPYSIQNAFLLVSDYFRYYLADEFAKQSNSYVVLDRFYHSTCVQNIIQEYKNNQTKNYFQNISSYAYQWPIDLPLPYLVVYLHVTPEEKSYRFHKSNITIQKIEQEQEQKEDQDQDQEQKQEQEQEINDELLQSLYSLIEGPPIIAMDASGTPSIVLETFFQCLESYSLYFRKPSSPLLLQLNEQINTSTIHQNDNQTSSYSIIDYDNEENFSINNFNRNSKRYSMSKINPFTIKEYNNINNNNNSGNNIGNDNNNSNNNNNNITNQLEINNNHENNINIHNEYDDQVDDERKRYSLGIYGAIMKVYTN